MTVQMRQGDEGGYLSQAGITFLMAKEQRNLWLYFMLRTPFEEKPAKFVKVQSNGVAYYAHLPTGTLYKKNRAVNSPFLEMLYPMTPEEVTEWEEEVV